MEQLPLTELIAIADALNLKWKMAFPDNTSISFALEIAGTEDLVWNHEPYRFCTCIQCRQFGY